MLPLAGIRVLDLSQEIAGPYAAMLLAEQGAEVVKLEPPDGDPGRRHPGFHVWNRSKTGAVFDPDHRDHHHLQRLLALADILVTSWHPGAAPGDLNPEIVKSAYPHLVHLWMPPFGSNGPLAGVDADDTLVAAAAGLLGGQSTSTGDPVYLTIPFASYGAAFVGVSAAMAALLARERSGRGQVVEVSWLAGALAMTTGGMVNAPKVGVMRMMSALRAPLGAMPAYRLYECGDGGWLFLACGNDVFFNKMALAIDRSELVADPRFQNAPWGIVEPADREALAAIVGERLRSGSREHWLAVFEQADVPAAPVSTREEFIDDAQVQHNEMRVELDDPKLGLTVQSAVALQVGETRPRPTGPAPTPGSRSIRELWQKIKPPARPQPPPGEDLKSAAGPLSGVRVLDLSYYIAGPLGPQMLADYGADVVKVEPLTGDPFRVLAVGFLGWNRGKRSLAVDTRGEEGRRIVTDLAARADILVENFRPGVTRRLGIDYETFKLINPRLVYCSVVGNGFDGPRGDRPAFDPLLQARSGAMAAQGGAGNPVFFTVPVSDHSAALMIAYGALCGLWMRNQTGVGSHVRLSLTNATLAGQSGQFIFGDQVPCPTPLPSEPKGLWPGYRMYRCHDQQWIFVACRDEEQWHSLCRATNGSACSYDEAMDQPADGDSAVGLRTVFAAMPAAVMLASLRANDVPAALIKRPLDLFSDPQLLANDLITRAEHPRFDTIEQTGLLAKFAATPGRVGPLSPESGQHTRDILAEMGRTPTQIEKLIEKGVVAALP